MEEVNSIDQAIQSLETQILEHRKEGLRVQLYAFIFGALILAAGYSIYLFQVYDAVITQTNDEIPTDTSLIYVFVGVFIVVFGVLMSIYRFHLSEISRAQQHKQGLQRIRIAANNYDIDGFGSEVREALTAGAFDFSTGKEKKIESPLPGHPTSDISTIFLNKLLDSIRINVKDKDKDT